MNALGLCVFAVRQWLELGEERAGVAGGWLLPPLTHTHVVPPCGRVWASSQHGGLRAIRALTCGPGRALNPQGRTKPTFRTLP